MMANENDEVHQNSNNSNGSSGSREATATVGEDGVAKQTLAAATGEDEVATCARGKLNDLVADLCLNGAVHGRVSGVSVALGGFGDYTNIRATQLTTPTEYAEGNPCHKQDVLSDNQASSSTANQATIHTQPPTQNAASSFSFKHFLNSSSAMTAPSTTVTSLDPVGVSANTSSAAAPVAATSSSNPLQTSTGARPKVPQSASVSATSISSLTVTGGSQDSAAATRMKRSPRFSSFDSQASLAEYAGVGAESGMEGGSAMGGSGGIGATTGFRLYPDALGGGGEGSDFFASCRSANVGGSSTITTNSSDFERQFVPRSFSNYDMPPASPRHRRSGVVAGGSGSGKESRPTRLALNTNSSKLKLDLPIENAANAATAARSLPPNNTGDFVPAVAAAAAAAAAAALPDFVQDHWIESWYAHEMYLNSPPNSPIGEFAEDAAGGGGAAGGSGAGVAAGCEVGAGAAATCGGPSGNAGIAGGIGATNEPPSGGGSKMLPDFLSDGPIIHSSQRLADVAAGLPSNSMGSPEDPPMSASRLRTENERLQRELNETRAALNEQTRRASDMSRQLQERQRNDSAYSRSMSQNITLVEESLDKSKRRTAAAQSHVTKLKQQVTQLTAEVETLRRENEALREEGAVGGCSAPPSCDRPYAAAAAGARGNANVARPSRTQQISRDLLKAASSAENNLRQLLAGVDNLRQMAADIETSERLDYDVSPDLFSDFLDDCDDYEEYPGGPAL